jgi:HK97 gp10 family phage protein
MPGQVKASWRIESDKFAEFKRSQHAGAERAAVRLAGRAERRAKEVASERVKTGAMREGISFKVFVRDTGRVSIVGTDAAWYWHFQDRGTKRGVTPLLFMEHGLGEVSKSAVEEIAEANKVTIV